MGAGDDAGWITCVGQTGNAAIYRYPCSDIGNAGARLVEGHIDLAASKVDPFWKSYQHVDPGINRLDLLPQQFV